MSLATNPSIEWTPLSWCNRPARVIDTGAHGRQTVRNDARAESDREADCSYVVRRRLPG